MTEPSYPQFTGREPCAEIGFEPYYQDETRSRERELMKAACDRCPLLVECAEWAIHRERWGYWAGLTMTDRERIRRQRGILVSEPQYVFLPVREYMDDSAA